nr:sensor domain-containing protein [Vibrio vulnificus]
MRPRTAWQALTHAPLSFLRTGWPWRALGYLLSGVVFGAVAAVVLLALAAAGLVTLLPLPAVALSGIWVARVERLRLRLVDPDPVPDPHRAPDAPGLRAWLGTRLREPATWRELGFTAV